MRALVSVLPAEAMTPLNVSAVPLAASISALVPTLPTVGSVGTNALIDAASGTALTLSGVIASAGNTDTNALIVNSGAGNNGTVILANANTYRGSTTISNGLLQVANALALQNSTLDYNNYGGSLVFDPGTSAATLGGLTGGQDLGLTNLASGGVTLTVGNNNASTTYAGGMNRS